jgi:DNA repair ATPase RecN
MAAKETKMTSGEVTDYLDLLFKVGEIGSIVVGVGLALRQMGKASAKTEAILQAQNEAMGELKEDIKVLNKVVTEVALQSQRLDQITERINTLDRRQDEMRHGKGFIN